MRKTTLFLAILTLVILTLVIPTLVACGGSESDHAAGTVGETAPPGKAATAASGPQATGGNDPKVLECIADIREGRTADAKAVCAEAAKRYPDNEDVKAALEMAELGELGPT